MNQDLTGNQYPPPGYQGEGPVTIGGDGGTTIPIDATPTEGSSNAVSSGGVYSAFQAKEDVIQPVEVNPTDYVWVGNKTWRPLLTWVQQLLDNAIGAIGFSWDQITGKPAGLITEEADPTVPRWVKTITQVQADALQWFANKFQREELPPGNVLIVGEDGDSVTSKPLGEMLATFFPALSAILSGVVSAPTSITVTQKGFDVEIAWTDIARTSGYYHVEVRYRISGGAWSEWLLVNQQDYTSLKHLWTAENHPSGMTEVAGRVRYIDALNKASAWIMQQTAFDEDEEVIDETTYEVVPGTVRWWQDVPPVDPGETTYEVVAASVRWYSAVTVEPPTSTPNPPVIKVTRYNANTISVEVIDTNPGKVDHYEMNYRVKNTSSWYTLDSFGNLTINPPIPFLHDQIDEALPFNVKFLLANAMFSNAIIESRVRTVVDSVPSAWSSSVTEPTSGSGTPSPGVRTAKINIQKIDGVWSDTYTDSEGGKLAHYYVNGIALKGSGGTRIKFENVSFRAGLLIEVSKVFLDPVFFDSWADYEANHWQAAIGTGNEDKIGYYCQHNFKTY
ncbi:hypothetical protein [Runella sp.]|uniref:hypothetical protein n=1 Tax=Runella sp. TaxID=1960881 RepID=UPI003D11BA7D